MARNHVQGGLTIEYHEREEVNELLNELIYNAENGITDIQTIQILQSKLNPVYRSSAPQFAIFEDLETDDIEVHWSCEVCKFRDDGHNTPIDAYEQAKAHAQKCLKTYRKKQGTDEWPMDYTWKHFLEEMIHKTALINWISVVHEPVME